MNTRELIARWQSFHKASGLGAPLADEAQYEEALRVAGELMDELAGDEDSPVAGLIELLSERIRAYETRVHPWPDTATPAQVLRFLMAEHGLKQADLADIGSQGVVSEILNGKRDLNVRQITLLSALFRVSPATFFPAERTEGALLTH